MKFYLSFEMPDDFPAQQMFFDKQFEYENGAPPPIEDGCIVSANHLPPTAFLDALALFATANYAKHIKVDKIEIKKL